MLTLHLLDGLSSSPPSSSTAAGSSSSTSTSTSSSNGQCLLCDMFARSLPELANECERAELALRTATLLVYACELPAWATTTSTGGGANEGADAGAARPRALAADADVERGGCGDGGAHEMETLPRYASRDECETGARREDLCQPVPPETAAGAVACANGTPTCNSNTASARDVDVHLHLNETRHALRSLALHLKLAFDTYALRLLCRSLVQYLPAYTFLRSHLYRTETQFTFLSHVLLRHVIYSYTEHVHCKV